MSQILKANDLFKEMFMASHPPVPLLVKIISLLTDCFHQPPTFREAMTAEFRLFATEQVPVGLPMALALFDQPARASVRFIQNYVTNRVLAHGG